MSFLDNNILAQLSKLDFKALERLLTRAREEMSDVDMPVLFPNGDESSQSSGQGILDQAVLEAGIADEIVNSGDGNVDTLPILESDQTVQTEPVIDLSSTAATKPPLQEQANSYQDLDKVNEAGAVQELLNWIDEQPSVSGDSMQKISETGVSVLKVADSNTTSSVAVVKETQDVESVKEKEIRTISETSQKYMDLEKKKDKASKIITLKEEEIPSKPSAKNSTRPSPNKSVDVVAESSKHRNDESKCSDPAASPLGGFSGHSNPKRSSSDNSGVTADSRKRSPWKSASEKGERGVVASSSRSLDFDSLSDDEDVPPKKVFAKTRDGKDSGKCLDNESRSSDSDIQFLGRSSVNVEVTGAQFIPPSGAPIAVRISDSDSSRKTPSREFNPAGPHWQENYIDGDSTVALAPSELVVKARGLDLSLR